MGNTLLSDYLAYNPREDIAAFSAVPTARWLETGEQRALETFRVAATSVPAYREFLRTHGVEPESVRTIDGFRRLPLTDKENYFEHHSLAAVTAGGTLAAATVIHCSSGSTGEPRYWPKSAIQDINSCKGVELLFVNYFDVDAVSTLFICCFGMGPWSAGEIMHTSVKTMSDKGLKIAIVSPGLNVDQSFDILRDLGASFQQVIIGGYPSFLRDLAEEGVQRGVDFSRYNLRVLTGGEKYSENWRQYMASHLGLKQPHRDVASVYGTSEIGVACTSSPFVDFLRMYLHRTPNVKKALFGDVPLPSITQFLPAARYMEIINGEIVVTCMGAIPLVRYRTKDRGQVLVPADVVAGLPASFWTEYTAAGEPAEIPNLPILTIDGRSDAFTILAVNIYHDIVTHALEAPPLNDYLTGRFLAEKLESEDAAEHLNLVLELKPSVQSQARLAEEIREHLVVALAGLSSEYAAALAGAGERAKPLVELRPYRSDGFLAQSGRAGLFVTKDARRG